jgi:hypothetical protein
MNNKIKLNINESTGGGKVPYIKKPYAKKMDLENIIKCQEFKNLLEQANEKYEQYNNIEDGDTETDDAHLDNSDYLKNINDTTNKIQKLNIPTDGLDQINVNLINVVKQCNYCQKWFANKLIVDDKEGQLCKHCLYWVNYDERARLEFDKKCITQGFCIAEYIIEYNETHNSNKCTRNSDSGGCFLCDYKKGIPILNIMNINMLKQQKYVPNCDKNIENSPEFRCEIVNFHFKIPTTLIL